MGGVLVGFGIIGFVILVGYIAGRLKIGGPDAGYTLNRIAFFVTNPALLFTVLAHADLHVVFSSFILVAGIAAVAVALVYVLVARLWFKSGASETTIGAMASGYVNANNIGIPVAVYVLGDAQYVAPILLLQLIVFAPIALGVLDVADRGSASFRTIATQPFRNPMIIASVIGVVVAATGLPVPDEVYAPFELLGGAAVPLILLAFGMSLNGQRPFQAGTGRKAVLVSSLLKSVGMPVAAYLLAHFAFGMSGAPLFAAVVLAALPSAQNVFNFASRYGRGEVLARDTVLLTTIASVPVLLVIAALLAPL